MNLIVENGTECYITDLMHFYNHVNYLYRTDKNQKWTTNESVNNLCLIVGSNNIISLIENKENIKKKILEITKNISQQEESVFEKNTFQNRVAYFCIYGFNNNELVNINKEDVEVIINLIKNKIESNKNTVFICAVYHQDQEINHIHFLYYCKKKTKKIPIIEIIE